MKGKIILILLLLLTAFNLQSQEINYIEISGMKFKLDSAINSNNELYSYTLNKEQKEKIAVPRFYEDMHVVDPMTGELIKYFDYIPVDTIETDLNLGIISLKKSESYSNLNVKIVLDKEVCSTTEMILYLIYDKTRRFKINHFQNIEPLIDKFGQPDRIILEVISFRDNDWKEWNFYNIFHWEVKK